MRAVVFEGVERVRCDRVPDPRVEEPGDALVAVTLAAVCGSDLHAYHGRETGLDAGTVMGHEFVGRVVETGAGVETVRPGDAVLCPFTTSCGACFFCEGGLTARCEKGRLFGWVEKGRGLNGGQAEIVRVPLADSTLVPWPDDLPAEAAILLGDVLATGVYCADRAEAGPGKTAVVVGCGPVGLMAVLAARERGASLVLAVDSVRERLDLAARLGATPLDLASADVASLVGGATGGRGADCVLEAVGSPASARLAFEIARPGGTISSVGVHVERAFPFTPGEAYDKNITYRAGRCPARALMPPLVALARRRASDLASLFTHRYPLDGAPDAYATFAARRDGCVKALLVP